MKFITSFFLSWNYLTHVHTQTTWTKASCGLTVFHTLPEKGTSPQSSYQHNQPIALKIWTTSPGGEGYSNPLKPEKNVSTTATKTTYILFTNDGHKWHVPVKYGILFSPRCLWPKPTESSIIYSNSSEFT